MPGDRRRRAAKLRLGGMALRNGLLVHGPTHWAAAVRRARRHDRRGLGAQAARAPASTSVPGRARRRAPRRGDGRHPARQARAARGAAALPGPAVLGASAAAALAGARLRRRGAGGTWAPRWRAALVSLLPASPRCAAASSPTTTASSTRRSPPTSRAPTTPRARPRSTTAAARTSWRRCWPPTSPAPRCCTDCFSSTRPWAAGRGRARLAGCRRRGLRVVRAPFGQRDRAAAAPPRPRAAARCSARASPASASSRSGRAALAEILRVEGLRRPAARTTVSVVASGSRNSARRPI